MVTIREFPTKVKALKSATDELEVGQFTALVSCFGNVDSYGDRVVKGAFADDVERWKAGETLPIVWSHRWDDPFSNLGKAIEVKETDAGLWVKGQIEDLEDNPTAAQVHRLLLSGRVGQFSFAYDVLDGAMVEEEVPGAKGDAPMVRSVFELRKLKTHEAGPCLVGVNTATELLGAKAANLALAASQGRRLDGPSLKRLGQTIDALREVIVLHGAKTEVESEKVDESTGEHVDMSTGDGTLSTEPADESQTGQSPADDPDTSAKAAPVVARRVTQVELMFLS